MSLLRFFSREAPPPSKHPRTGSDNDGDRRDESNSESDSASDSESMSVMVTDSEPGPSSSTTTSESERSSGSHSSLRGGSRKQASGFKKEWLKGRQHWLKCIDGQGMFCTLCIKYDKRPYNRITWNKAPCTRFRLQSIVSHENSAAHCDCVKLFIRSA